ncbi:hypothetical protein BH747_08395 [Enterococcus villorum]|uniref:Uncharacterized protein n=1 Tax=Enterococcus villorum TaxID=112904 RepID=A0A1V8YGQ5_9ENTE|nr:hypothetical protein [Enterococcus villorum]OQO70170.1 hypothetical protein BH747_08395 [Enterococcus villorum]OQO71807.1 hypothetical protein BH744_13360 [Enterococcus villorum]
MKTLNPLTYVKVTIIAIVVVLLMNLGFSVSNAFASESRLNEQIRLTQGMLASISSNKKGDKFEMNTVILQENTDFTTSEATKLATTFNHLTLEEQQSLLHQLSENPNARVAPIILWAAGIVGGWLATKLLDWGATKFCKTYRNYNSATKLVCDVIG